MSGSGLDEQSLVLHEVFVLGNASIRQEFFSTQDEVLRAVVLRADLEQELGSGDGTLIGMNAPCAKLALVLLQIRGCARRSLSVTAGFEADWDRAKSTKPKSTATVAM